MPSPVLSDTQALHYELAAHAVTPAEQKLGEQIEEILAENRSTQEFNQFIEVAGRLHNRLEQQGVGVDEWYERRDWTNLHDARLHCALKIWEARDAGREPDPTIQFLRNDLFPVEWDL